MKFLKFFIPSIFIFLLMLAPSIVHAGIEPSCDPDQPCPIDTNVILLIAAAVLVAGFKYYSAVKKKLAI
jgi:hypothetical protein